MKTNHLKLGLFLTIIGAVTRLPVFVEASTNQVDNISRNQSAKLGFNVACDNAPAQILKTDSSFQETECYLKELKSALEYQGYVYVPGHRYFALLIYFGATVDDLIAMETGSVHQHVARDREANMSFRQVAFHRILLHQLDSVETHTTGKDNLLSDNPSTLSTTAALEDGETKLSLQRGFKLSYANCEAVTQLSEREICSDQGAKVYFKRSGTRKWSLPPVQYTKTSIPDAIARLNAYLNPSYHHYQSNVIQNSCTTIDDQVLIRINQDESSDAEPTPEGIHQDSTELSSVTLIRRENVREDKGGESRIWKLEQPTGNYDSDKFCELKQDERAFPVNPGFSWDHCIFDKSLIHPWETIIFNDRKVKHEVRPFLKKNEDQERCYRDVIVNFIRKPLLDGSDKHMVNGKEESII